MLKHNLHHEFGEDGFFGVEVLDLTQRSLNFETVVREVFTQTQC